MKNQILNTEIGIGTRIRLSGSHSDMSTYTYVAKVVRVDYVERTAWVEIPERVRNLKFAPYDGKRFALFAMDTLVKA